MEPMKRKVFTSNAKLPMSRRLHLLAAQNRKLCTSCKLNEKCFLHFVECEGFYHKY